MKPFKNALTTKLLRQTESLCPVCLEVIDAQVVMEDRAVYQQKVCSRHGAFKTYLWPDADHYIWMNSFEFPCVRPKLPVKPHQGCPLDCGPCTSHLRQPTLVEIELTQRCNLRCPVCFMAAGTTAKKLIPDPDLQELAARFKAIMARTGPQTSIQLTGGEPTVRTDLPEIICLGREIGFEAIEVNTNGFVIASDLDYVRQLAGAGVSGIYLQFDGVTKSVYEQIRGADLLAVKRKAIENCRTAGVQVVLAMTVIRGINDDQLGAVLEFAVENRDVIVGIAYQPAFGSGRFDIDCRQPMTMGDVAFLLAKQSKGLLEAYDLWPLACAPLCDSATYLLKQHDKFTPITRLITRQEYTGYYHPDSPQGSVFWDIAAERFPDLERGLSIIIMNFMDGGSIDLARLRECSMLVADAQGRMIPFCAYQLTGAEGKALHKNITLR